MHEVGWCRLGSVAAIVGEPLRIVNVFIVGMLGSQTLGGLYIITDVLLLLGVTARYMSRRTRLGLSGIVGLILSITGILIIRTPEFFGGEGYQAGAIVLLVGVVAMSIAAAAGMAQSIRRYYGLNRLCVRARRDRPSTPDGPGRDSVWSRAS